MPISDNIKKLTDLALTDRILTYKERQVIAETALKEGISQQEINSYLDDALHERLKTYSKEQLKHCPYCGAQIPLISDVCLFCGETLDNTEPQPNQTATPPPYITGDAAKIIRSENARTAVEQHNLKTCPDCGAPFPLVSNVCTHCGHILHEQQYSDLNVKRLIENIQQSIDEIKATPQPTVWEVICYRKKLLLFFISMILLIPAIRGFWLFTSSTTIITLFVSSALLWVAAVAVDANNYFTDWRTTKKNTIESKSPVRLADRQFYSAMYREERYAAQIHTLYGDNTEAQNTLNEYSALIAEYKKAHNHNRKMLTISLLGIFVVMILMLSITPSSRQLYDNQLDTYPEFYGLADKKITLNINEQHPVSPELAPYITVSGNAVLTYDIQPFDGQYIRAFDSGADITLRVSGIRINPIGELPDSLHAFNLRLVFWDKDGNKVATEFGDMDVAQYEDIYYLDDKLRNGKGGYVEFVSDMVRLEFDEKWSYNNIYSIISNISSYSIY